MSETSQSTSHQPTSTTTLKSRNRKFAAEFSDADLPILPKLRTVILTCVDARVDPAHVLGVDLGEAVVMRNNGGRVTPEVLQEIATLAFMVGMLDGDTPGPFEVMIMQHTQCGAERFADPQFQQVIKGKLGIDVSGSAITNHEESLLSDIEQLRNAPEVPAHVVVSGFIYDVADGLAHEVVPAAALGAL